MENSVERGSIMKFMTKYVLCKTVKLFKGIGHVQRFFVSGYKEK